MLPRGNWRGQALVILILFLILCNRGDYLCDSPKILIDSLFTELKELGSIDFVIWTGDNLPHDIWLQSKEYQLSVIKKITDELIQIFNVPIFPVIGNYQNTSRDI
jgi:hypothetical protein